MGCCTKESCFRGTAFSQKEKHIRHSDSVLYGIVEIAAWCYEIQVTVNQWGWRSILICNANARNHQLNRANRWSHSTFLLAETNCNANHLPTIEDRGICSTNFAGGGGFATYDAETKRKRSVEAGRFLTNTWRILPRCTQDMVPHSTLSLIKVTSTRQPYNDVS